MGGSEIAFRRSMSLRRRAGLPRRPSTKRQWKDLIMTASHVSLDHSVTRGRRLSTALWAGQIVFAVFFAFTAAPKLLGDPTAVASFESIGFGQWFRYLTGACELAGAIGLVIPRLSGVAALGLTGLMVGATATNLFLLPGMAPAAIVTVLLGVVFLLIARARRPETTALVRALRRRA
jgi:putative oxidoreductase